MKHIAITTIAFLSFVLPSGAVSLDVDSFGAALHGWRKDRTASYTINNNRYRTHRPTATRTQGGGLFLSTRIEAGGRLSTGAVSFLELTFTPEGNLVAAQIRATISGKRLDTGLVTRRAAAPTLPEDFPAAGAENGSPTDALVMDLFSRFDTELGKLDKKDGEKPRRDVFGRVTGGAMKHSDVPAALRHNLNLLLSHIQPGWDRGK